jgi:superfamily II DNA or RNA helicase
MSDYAEFLRRKQQHADNSGFDPLWMPEFLFDFQQYLVDWALVKGRAAIFADCGLGKTAMQLVWAQNVVQKTNKPVLILTPLAVSDQTVREAAKFGLTAVRSREGKGIGELTVTNYERLHYFNPADFAGVVCDESSILKNIDGATQKHIREFNKRIPYRLLCTATAAPNDFLELGTSSEALGYLGARDMVTMFFKEKLDAGGPGWQRQKRWLLRGHAEGPFWRWICSWARACRKPSDLGFSDGNFNLPKLVERQIVVHNSVAREGMLFPVQAVGLQEEREERRANLVERCELVADIISPYDDPCVSWCQYNNEGDMLERMIPGARQIKGSMKDEEKEEIFNAFASGELSKLITKPKIGCFGLNWQHCNRITTFPSHSYEQYYQAVRRCWRFGQTRPVYVDIVSTEGEAGVTANLQRKAEQAERMFTNLVQFMNDALKIEKTQYGTTKEELPSWL